MKMKESCVFNAFRMNETENWVNSLGVVECVNLYKHHNGDHYVLEYANQEGVEQLGFHDGDTLFIEGLKINVMKYDM